MSETIDNLLFEDKKPKKDCFYYVNSCPLCESKKLNTLFKQWGILYRRCKTCSFIFSNPRLTDKGAYIWYNSDYYNAAMQTEHFTAETANKYYSISLDDVHFLKTISFIERQNFNKNISIADVGCGSGSFLHYLRDKLNYKDVKGFDLNKSNIDFAGKFRKLELTNLDVYKLEENQKFDLIITTENIEHVSDPNKYIEQILKITKYGTYLLITTPHNDKKAVKLMGLKGDYFCAPNHQNYFNFFNLSRLLNKYGFKIVDYWIDDSYWNNLYSVIKERFRKNEQVTSFPPIKSYVMPMFKWQKDHHKSIVIKKMPEAIIENGYSSDKISPKSISHYIRKGIRKVLSLAQIQFKKHQIILVKYGGQ